MPSWISYLFGTLEVSGQTILAFIAALTALVSTIVGPLVAFKIATRSANLVAHVAERKEWIQQFRNDVANYISTAIRVRANETAQEAGALDNDDLVTQAVAHLENLTVLFYKIILRLDTAKPEHLAIITSLHSLDAACRERPPSTSDIDMRNLRQILADQCRELIMIELQEISGQENSRTIPTLRERKHRQPEKVLVKEYLYDGGVEDAAKK